MRNSEPFKLAWRTTCRVSTCRAPSPLRTLHLWHIALQRRIKKLGRLGRWMWHCQWRDPTFPGAAGWRMLGWTLKKLPAAFWKPVNTWTDTSFKLCTCNLMIKVLIGQASTLFNYYMCFSILSSDRTKNRSCPSCPSNLPRYTGMNNPCAHHFSLHLIPQVSARCTEEVYSRLQLCQQYTAPPSCGCFVCTDSGCGEQEVSPVVQPVPWHPSHMSEPDWAEAFLLGVGLVCCTDQKKRASMAAMLDLNMIHTKEPKWLMPLFISRNCQENLHDIFIFGLKTRNTPAGFRNFPRRLCLFRRMGLVVISEICVAWD